MVFINDEWDLVKGKNLCTLCVESDGRNLFVHYETNLL